MSATAKISRSKIDVEITVYDDEMPLDDVLEAVRSTVRGLGYIVDGLAL